MGASGAAPVLGVKAFRNVPRTGSQNSAEARRLELHEVLKGPFLDGYFLQFGVHRGTTLNIMAKEKPDVHWYGFDSFEGLPEPWNMGGKKYDKGKFACDMPAVEQNCTLIKGWFKDTVPDFARRMTDPAAFMDIDCDLYSSTRDVLFGLNERIVPGTVIHFDELCDWRKYGWAKHDTGIQRYSTWADHEWKALKEWLEECEREVIPIHRSDHLAGTVKVTV